jgi:hypothetical protein
MDKQKAMARSLNAVAFVLRRSSIDCPTSKAFLY